MTLHIGCLEQLSDNLVYLRSINYSGHTETLGPHETARITPIFVRREVRRQAFGL